MLYSTKKRKNQDVKINLEDDLWDFQRLLTYPRNNFCQKEFPSCKWCTSHYCTKHGQYQRIETRNQFGDQPPGTTALAIVLQFGHFLHPKMASQVRQNFIMKLTKIGIKNDYIWRWEFGQNSVHLNCCYLCYSFRHFEIESKALCINFTNQLYEGPKGSAHSHVSVVRDWDDWLDYIFKTKQVLPPEQCPIKIPGQKWYSWGCSKGFPRK